MTDQPDGTTRRLAVVYDALSRCLRAAGHEVPDLDRHAIAAGIVDALDADDAGRLAAVRPAWLPPAGFRDTFNARPDVPRPLSELSLEDQMRTELDDDPGRVILAQLVRAHVKRCTAAHWAAYNDPTVAALPMRYRIEVAQQTVQVLTDPCRRPSTVGDAVDAVTARTGAPPDAVMAAVSAAVLSLSHQEQP